VADLNHLHLHVRDLARSTAFYERWFGLSPSRRFGEVHFLRGEEGFDLALVEDPEGFAWPPWFHVGFRLGEPAAVSDLHARMNAAGIDGVGDLHRDEELVFFRVRDPDGLAIDVYWE
jgi:catechol 2,3-dioxygenase-like lactoylglutathione lyase family enzyme